MIEGDSYKRIEQIAAVFGQEVEKPFKVVGGLDEFAVLRFSYRYGMERFDGTSWAESLYFLPHMMIGEIKVVEEFEQGELFE